MKVGYKPLLMAIFLGVAGLTAGTWHFPQASSIEERVSLGKSLASPILIGVAQGAEVNNSGALVQDAVVAVMTDPADMNGQILAGSNNQSYIIDGSAAIQDPGQPIGEVLPSSTNSTIVLPNFNKAFGMPAAGKNLHVLSSDNSVDIENLCGTPVVAAAAGLVVPDPSTPNAADGWNNGYGNFVLIQHSFGDGVSTRYAHLEKVLVQIGDEVTKGQEIGLMGESGGVSTCDLGFEVIGARNPLAK